MSNKKRHFQIPDSETHFSPAKHKLIPTAKEGFDYLKHSENLLSGIRSVSSSEQDSLIQVPLDATIFKLSLDDGQNIERRGNFESVFTGNGLIVRALISPSEAVVSSTRKNIETIEKKLLTYGSTQKDRQIWDFVKDISTFTPNEKISSEVVTSVKSGQLLDVNIVVAPLWDNVKEKSKFTDELSKKLLEMYPDQPPIETIDLSDNTISAHTFLPSSALNRLAEQNFVMSIEPADYFSGDSGVADGDVSLGTVKLDPSVDIENLPVVVVIDDGIALPKPLAALVKGVYSPDNLDEVVSSTSELFGEHGTRVASRCIFGKNLLEQYNTGIFKPRVQVIDAPVITGELSAQVLTKRFREVVAALHGVASTFIFAYNARTRFDAQHVSILGSEIDSLVYQYGINFVTPSGNHELYLTKETLPQILHSRQARISAPSDGFLVTSVGSVRFDGTVSSFSRIGTGFNGSLKPGVVYQGGDYGLAEAQGHNEYAEVISKQGYITHDIGTSFSTPLAAADLAITQSYCITNLKQRVRGVSSNRIAAFQAKALFYHRASQSDNSVFDPTIGFGQVDLSRVLYSYSDDATYVRYGRLKRKQRQFLTFRVPEAVKSILHRGRKSLRVSVTVLDFPTGKRISGADYLDGYVYTSFHLLNSVGNKHTNNPAGLEGRQRWYNLQHFTQDLSAYAPGDWELTLEYFSKPTISDETEMEYVVLITLEDIAGNQIDLYSGIEATNRFNVGNFIDVSDIHETSTTEKELPNTEHEENPNENKQL